MVSFAKTCEEWNAGLLDFGLGEGAVIKLSMGVPVFENCWKEVPNFKSDFEWFFVSRNKKSCKRFQDLKKGQHKNKL